MSFIYFAHIKARRNPKSILFLPSALPDSSPLCSPSCTWFDLSVCPICAGDRAALKYKLVLREEERKKRGGSDGQKMKENVTEVTTVAAHS